MTHEPALRSLFQHRGSHVTVADLGALVGKHLRNTRLPPHGNGSQAIRKTKNQSISMSTAVIYTPDNLSASEDLYAGSEECAVADCARIYISLNYQLLSITPTWPLDTSTSALSRLIFVR
jgi:hypothetical protein